MLLLLNHRSQAFALGLTIFACPFLLPLHGALQVLGGGIDVVTIGARTYIRSVPGEFNMDKNKVMELAQQQGYISAGVCVCQCMCQAGSSFWDQN